MKGVSVAVITAGAAFLSPLGAWGQRPLGIDVSSYQGNSVNWSQVKGGGYTFAWAKATEGTGVIDADFTINQNNARSAGVYIGAYHFAHPNLNSPGSEASYFWNEAGPYVLADGLTLMPMLDMEVFSGVTGASSYTDWANQWCNNIVGRAATNNGGVKVTPVIYVSACNAGNFTTAIAQWIPWIADYNGESPQSGTPWSTCTADEEWGSGVWDLWQYSSSLTVPGVTTGSCDTDVFNGTSSGLVTTLVATSTTINNATLVGSYGIPGSVYTGATFVAAITFRNSGIYAWTNTGSPYQLGSQSPSGNATWGLSTVSLPSSPIYPTTNVTFKFTATAPATIGSYTFAWRMINGADEFGDTFSTTINVVTTPSTSGGTWWGNADITPTTLGHPSGTLWATTNDCSQGTYWYIYSHYTDCSARGFYMTFDPGFKWNGRGYIHTDWLNCGSTADSIVTLHFLNQLGNLTGETATHNDCAGPRCAMAAIKDAEVPDVYQYNGIYRTADEDTSGTCGNVCGYVPGAGREMHMYGDKWVYLNDWVTFGGFANSNGVSTVGWGPPFGEPGVYVYGAIDTTHGNYFANNLYGGHTPYRVQTGDCGADTLPGSASYPNYLNFQGNAGQNGNNNCLNCDAYAFAWVQAASAAAPQWGVGSDDGNRIWLNGTLIADTNAARGLTWDQDRFLPATGMAAGWNRVLFKVHNITGPSSGVISLHNGTDFRQIEPNVYMQPDRYTGYSLGYEQDAWYPTIQPASVYGDNSPTNATAHYGNDTTVNISGSSGINAGSPVPYWQTMEYEWGYGIPGDSNYAPVSGTPTSTSWSHAASGVTGHRRFYLFAVSQSGRTSFQNSGRTGGSTFSDTGNYGRYYDIYVDNVAPVTPGFATVTVAGTSEVDLTWAIPLDQGVNIANSATERRFGIASGGANGYVRGDVGVQVYRNAGIISAWGNGTSVNDTGLTPNTMYIYTIEARDNNSGLRGAWNNTTGPQGSTAAWTLSVPPTSTNVTPDQASPPVTTPVTWTALGGFGPGTIQYYLYAWDTSPTHTWTGSEPQWSSGTLSTVPTSVGAWYFHVQGYNGANVADGSADLAVNAVLDTSSTALASSQNPSAPGSNVTFTATVSAVTGTNTPTGNVVFSLNGIPFSTNSLSGAAASVGNAALPAGTNSILAQYGGDSFFNGSSNSLQQIVQTSACSQTNILTAITANSDGTFTLSFLGTPQASYYVIANSNLVVGAWSPLAGSTNTVTDTNGFWQVTVSNSALQQFYRSVAITPCP